MHFPADLWRGDMVSIEYEPLKPTVIGACLDKAIRRSKQKEFTQSEIEKRISIVEQILKGTWQGSSSATPYDICKNMWTEISTKDRQRIKTIFEGLGFEAPKLDHLLPDDEKNFLITHVSQP